MSETVIATHKRSQATSIQLDWPLITFVCQVFRLRQSIPIIFKKLKVINIKTDFIICLLNLTCFNIRVVINEASVSGAVTVQNAALIKHNRKCQGWITNGYSHHCYTTVINTYSALYSEGWRRKCDRADMQAYLLLTSWPDDPRQWRHHDPPKRR